MIKTRLANFRLLLKKQNLDSFLVTLPANRRYLSGFTPADGQWGESSGALLITACEAILFTDFRYALTARQQAPYFKVIIYRQGLSAELERIFAPKPQTRLGFEADALLAGQYERLKASLAPVELVPLTGMVNTLRALKDKSERQAIKKSLLLIEQVMAEVRQMDMVGLSELALARHITRRVEDLGAEGVSFPPIVAAGPAGAEPHAEPGPAVISPGQTVIIDVGACVDGYASDITRTFIAGPSLRADPEIKNIYAVVRKALQAALTQIKPGMSGAQADATARSVIDQAGYGLQFGHSLGHGVGLMIHEAPSLSPLSQTILKPGMIFTLEPGIYLPGLGGVRLEQMVELTSAGCVLLNEFDGFYDEFK